MWLLFVHSAVILKLLLSSYVPTIVEKVVDIGDDDWGPWNEV